MAQTSTWAVPSAPSGLSMRNTVNTILDVLRTASSGASAPASAVAGQFWLDTGVSPAVLRQRNAANTAWLVVNPETIPANTLRGNPTGAAAPEQDVSASQLRTLLGFAQTAATAGYIQLPGGILLQWLTSSVLASGTNVFQTWPLAFPNACWGAWTTYTNTGSDPAVGATFIGQVRALGVGGVTIRNLGSGAANFFAFGVGN